MLTFGLSQLCAFSPSACNWAQTFTGSNLDYSVVFLCSAGGSVFICKHTKASRRHRQCSVKQTHTVPASYGHFVGKIDLKWYPVGSPGNAVFSMGLFQVLSYMSSFNPHNSPMMEGWVFSYPFFFFNEESEATSPRLHSSWVQSWDSDPAPEAPKIVFPVLHCLCAPRSAFLEDVVTGPVAIEQRGINRAMGVYAYRECYEGALEGLIQMEGSALAKPLRQESKQTW